MIKALSLAAALALLPLSASVAKEARGPSEDALEAAASAFEARMDEFGDRAEAIGEDESLSAAQRELRIHALWAEYQPEVTRFTTLVSQYAPAIAQEALADIDIDAIVEDALKQVDDSGALAVVRGIAANNAWASNDPAHMETMGLVAQYAIAEATDSVDEALTEADTLAAEAAADAADEADDADETVKAPPAPAQPAVG